MTIFKKKDEIDLAYPDCKRLQSPTPLLRQDDVYDFKFNQSDYKFNQSDYNFNQSDYNFNSKFCKFYIKFCMLLTKKRKQHQTISITKITILVSLRTKLYRTRISRYRFASWKTNSWFRHYRKGNMPNNTNTTLSRLHII